MTKISKTERDEQIEKLRAWFPKGSTVYTILRSVSRSGMSRTIGVIAILSGEKIDIRCPNYAIGLVLGYREDRKADGLRVNGAGMDMGFDLAYSLARALYGDGYALNHKWL
jgi:hypothetical protein